MPTYSLLTAAGPLDLTPHRRTYQGDEVELVSVGSSRIGPETIGCPDGLQADAVKAAERVALDRLALTGQGQSVDVVKTLADGSTRLVASATAHLDHRAAGRAIVESADRGSRSCELALTLDGETWSRPVMIAQALAELVTGGLDEVEALELVAGDEGLTARAVAELAKHGVAIVKRATARRLAGQVVA